MAIFGSHFLKKYFASHPLGFAKYNFPGFKNCARCQHSYLTFKFNDKLYQLNKWNGLEETNWSPGHLLNDVVLGCYDNEWRQRIS